MKAKPFPPKQQKTPGKMGAGRPMPGKQGKAAPMPPAAMKRGGRVC